MTKRMYAPNDPALAAMKPEQRLALYNNGQIVGQGPPNPDDARTRRGEKPLSHEELQRLHGLERERELQQAHGRDLHPRLRMEMGDLQDRHKRTAPHAAPAQNVVPSAIDRAREALERAHALFAEAEDWESAGRVQLQLDKLDQPRN